MNDSRSKKRRARKAKKTELQERKIKADRRRRGLAPNQEEAELASYLRRLLAFVIDQVIYVFFFFFYLIILAAIAGQSFTTSVGSIFSVIVFGLIYFIPGIKRHGQTYGCKKTRIVVIDQSGEKYLSLSASVIRWFTSLGIPAIFSWLALIALPDSYAFLMSIMVYVLLMSITFIPILRSQNRQGIHDMLSRAIVIKELKL